MDDADRAIPSVGKNALKAISLVGILISVGAGCAKEELVGHSNESQIQEKQVSRTVSSSSASLPEVDFCSVAYDAMEDGIVPGECAHVLRNRYPALMSLSGGSQFDLYASTTSIGRVFYFVYNDAQVVSKKDILTTDITPVKNVDVGYSTFGVILPNSKDVIFSPKIGLQFADDPSWNMGYPMPEVVHPRLVPDANEYGFAIEGLGVGLSRVQNQTITEAWKTVLRFNPSTKKISECGFTKLQNPAKQLEWVSDAVLTYPKECEK